MGTSSKKPIFKLSRNQFFVVLTASAIIIFTSFVIAFRIPKRSSHFLYVPPITDSYDECLKMGGQFVAKEKQYETDKCILDGWEYGWSPTSAPEFDDSDELSPISLYRTKVFPSSIYSSAACLKNSEGDFVVIPISKKECRLVLPLPGYSVSSYEFNYPTYWSVRIAGAESMNLVFNEGREDMPEWAIYLTTSQLPLSESYKASYGFEFSPTTHFVKESESTIAKNIETYGENQVLSLLTDENGVKRQKYFILKKEGEYSSVYIFDLKENLDPDFIAKIQDILSSFHAFDISE